MFGFLFFSQRLRTGVRESAGVFERGFLDGRVFRAGSGQESSRRVMRLPSGGRRRGSPHASCFGFFLPVRHPDITCQSDKRAQVGGNFGFRNAGWVFRRVGGRAGVHRRGVSPITLVVRRESRLFGVELVDRARWLTLPLVHRHGSSDH